MGLEAAILLLDGADFERIITGYNTFNGSIRLNSIDSARNWIQILTGDRPRDNGVLGEGVALGESGVEQKSYVDVPNNIKSADVRSDFLYEELENEGWSVGTFFVLGTSPEIEVTCCIPDRIDRIPAPDWTDEILEGGSLMDVNAEDVLQGSYNMARKKTEIALEKAEEKDLEIVSVGYVATDTLAHKHMKGAMDDLIEEIFKKYKDKAEKVILVSDHKVRMRTETRQAEAKHSLPAKFCIYPGEGHESLEPTEFNDVLKEEIGENGK